MQLCDQIQPPLPVFPSVVDCQLLHNALLLLEVLPVQLGLLQCAHLLLFGADLPQEAADTARPLHPAGDKEQTVLQYRGQQRAAGLRHIVCTQWPGWWRADGRQPQQLQAGSCCPQSCSAAALEAPSSLHAQLECWLFCQRAFSFIFLREQRAFRPREIIKSSSLTPCIHQAKPFH